MLAAGAYRLLAVGLFCLFTGVQAFAQWTSNFCVSVGDNGFVQLSWSPPLNPDPFLNYEVFRDNGAGFQSLGQFGPATLDNYTDFDQNTNQTASYFVRTIINGVPGEESPVLNNTVLNLSAAQLSIPFLSWQPPYPGALPTGEVRVYRSVDGEPFVLYAEIPINRVNFNDTLFGFCTDTIISYRVSYADGVCEMFSQIVSNEFRDNLAPPQPVIETVTVDENGNVVVYWYPVNVPDINFYRVQRIDLINQLFINIGTIQAGMPAEFVYDTAPPNQSTTIAVIAFDQCNNEASFGTAVSTMYLECIYTECDTDVLLSWNPYEGWQQGVNRYSIYASTDGGEPELIDEVGFQSLFYSVEVDPNRNYCFWIEAQANGLQRPSSSNRKCLETIYPDIIAYNYTSRVTTLADNKIEIELLLDPESEGTRYELYRSRSGGNFLKLTSINQTADETLTYIDTDVDAKNIKYTYKWKAYDGCDAFVSESNLSSNLVLKALPDTRELINFLSWNAYEGWNGEVAGYELYRKEALEANYELLATLGSDQLEYIDDMEPFMGDGGAFCYKIIAFENLNEYGLMAESNSNGVCASQPPLMWIPNTVVINGQPENQIFKPIAGFIDFDSFQMDIYNKWGQRIFSSDDINQGWDAHYKGNPVREDFYQYIISYRDGSGKVYIERDVLYVIKF